VGERYQRDKDEHRIRHRVDRRVQPIDAVVSYAFLTDMCEVLGPWVIPEQMPIAATRRRKLSLVLGVDEPHQRGSWARE
jgi:hypothetical protein